MTTLRITFMSVKHYFKGLSQGCTQVRALYPGLLCICVAMLLSSCSQSQQPDASSEMKFNNLPQFTVLREETPEVFPLPEKLVHPDSGRAAIGADLDNHAKTERNIRIFGGNLPPPVLLESDHAARMRAATGIPETAAESAAIQRAQEILDPPMGLGAAVLPVATQKNGGNAPHPLAPLPQRVKVIIAPPPSNPLAGEEAMLLITQQEREKIEIALGKPIEIVSVSPRFWRPLPRRGVIRYRQDKQIKAALLLATLLPRAQLVQAMNPRDRLRLSEDILIILSANP